MNYDGSMTDQILQAIGSDPAMDLRDAMERELVSLFSMDGQYRSAVRVGALGWACAEVLRQQCEALTSERDVARRLYCHAVANESGSWRDEPRIAAEKWGREVALALYTDEILHAMYFEWDCEEDRVAEDIAETHRRLDAAFPA